MDIFQIIWDYILHLDVNLHNLVVASPILSYFLLFFVIFLETGGVVTVFLPSDTVILVACSLAVIKGSFNLPILYFIFLCAALLGDSTNFSIGRALRKEVNKKGKVFFIKAKNLDSAKLLFQRSGTAAVISGRFIPILRSLAPFVSGLSENSYKWFAKRNAIGVFIWTSFYFSLGVIFGNTDFISKHFALITIGIAVVAILTSVISITIKNFAFKKKGKKDN